MAKYIGKILIACEFSGIVRDSFAARGWDAWSCDLIPSEKFGNHLQCDVLSILDDGWDMMIAHPPCTYLCSMGIWWNHKRPERWQMTYDAEEFFLKLVNANIPRIAVENPIGRMSIKFRKPDQIVNPWMFGEAANKPTCLWLKNLPVLQPTEIVGKGEFYVKQNGERLSVWSHKTKGGKDSERAKIASRTFRGLASAMADQWTYNYLNK